MLANISNFLFDQLFPSPTCQQGLQCVPEASCQVYTFINFLKIHKINAISYPHNPHTHQQEFVGAKTLLMAMSSSSMQYNHLLAQLKVSAKDSKLLESKIHALPPQNMIKFLGLNFLDFYQHSIIVDE